MIGVNRFVADWLFAGVLRVAWCVVGIGFFLLFQSAEAHAILVSAEPDTGASLPESPANITLTFSEPVGADSQIKLTGADFRPISDLSTTQQPQPNVLSVDLPPLDAGVYTVEYDTLSVDGHIIRGAYEFAVVDEGGFFGRIDWQTILLGVAAGVSIRLLLRYFTRR